MKIALLAPLWKRVPPERYGGSELVVANLAKGLTMQGNAVTTFCCAGSQVTGELVPVIPQPLHELVGEFDWSGVQPYEFLSFFKLAERINDFDIVHNHMGLHPVAFAPLLKIPLVTTLHSSVLPDFPYLADAFCKFPFVSVSDAQRRLAPQLSYVATVYHGIDTKSFTPRLEGRGGGFVFLGTLSRNKGIDIAVRSAARIGAKLTIAGEKREGDRSFLERDVFPFVDGQRIRFIGEIDHAQKARLLAEADALLFPSRWNEAFGLVMIEAMASGTPVVALDNGAISEILVHGQTGLIAHDEELFIEAMRRIGEISRARCRIEAERKFDLSVMADNYVNVYTAVQDNFFHRSSL